MKESNDSNMMIIGAFIVGLAVLLILLPIIKGVAVDLGEGVVEGTNNVISEVNTP